MLGYFGYSSIFLYLSSSLMIYLWPLSFTSILECLLMEIKFVIPFKSDLPMEIYSSKYGNWLLVRFLFELTLFSQLYLVICSALYMYWNVLKSEPYQKHICFFLWLQLLCSVNLVLLLVSCSIPLHAFLHLILHTYSILYCNNGIFV